MMQCFFEDLSNQSLPERRFIFDAILKPQKNTTLIEAYRYQWIVPVRFSCPCCGFPTLTERAMADICPLCEWQDDGRDDKDADFCPENGCNTPWSLAKARINFEQYGCMYDPGARYYNQFKAHQHPSLIKVKVALIHAFLALLDLEACEPLWNKAWLEVLRCTQDVIHVVGRAREKSKAKRKIVRVRLPEDEQPWVMESPGPAACLRQFADTIQQVYPNEAFSRCANYLDQLEKETLEKKQYDIYVPRLRGWMSFLAAACYELTEGGIPSFNGSQKELSYISTAYSEQFAMELLSLTELCGDRWFKDLSDDVRADFVRSNIKKARNLMHELIEISA